MSSKKKQYKVYTKFTFSGFFIVNAESNAQAQEIVAKDCGLVIGGNIHTTCDDETVPDWDFAVHPLKTITKSITIK